MFETENILSSYFSSNILATDAVLHTASGSFNVSVIWYNPSELKEIKSLKYEGNNPGIEILSDIFIKAKANHNSTITIKNKNGNLPFKFYQILEPMDGVKLILLSYE